jgi:glycosyltransferase involved in cell wall biosynthesis
MLLIQRSASVEHGVRATRVVSDLRVVGTVSVYNEADILGQVLAHLHEQGIMFVVLDGGSEDGSVEIAQSFRDKGLLEHRIVRRNSFTLREDLDCLIEMASVYFPDWILKNDADEFLEPREQGRTLLDAIVAEDQFGSNIIQFDNFEFCLTEMDSGSSEPDIRKRLRFYTWSDDFRYKAWRYYPGATYRESGGHYPLFPRGIKAKVSPRKLVMRHYRFRSPEQAVRRVFKERLPRYSPEERANGWHAHYDHFKEDPQFFVLDSDMLSRYDGDCRWDLTKRFDWYRDWRYPTREELFSGELGKLVSASLRIVREEGIRSLGVRALKKIAKTQG